MSQRITQRDLSGMCHRINMMLTGNDDGTGGVKDGKYTARVGAFYIDGAYGGVALYQIVTEGGGVTDVFGFGHVPKRELYHALHAFIRGIEYGENN